MDPNEMNDISLANSSTLTQLPFCTPPSSRVPSHQSLCAGQNIRKLEKDGLIIIKPQKIHSRSRTNRMKEVFRVSHLFGQLLFSNVVYGTPG